MERCMYWFCKPGAKKAVLLSTVKGDNYFSRKKMWIEADLSQRLRSRLGTSAIWLLLKT
jgi:hypothetical protein